MRNHAWAAALLLLAAACFNPTDPAGWAKRAAGRSRLDEKLEALDQVRKAPGDRKAAVPWLLQVLKQAPRARAEAALALGEIGDPAAVAGLVAAVDPAAADRDGFEANRKLAGALGALRAREGVPALVQLTASRDGFTQVAAVDALGAIGDAAAVEPLAALAASPAAEPVAVQHALLALGRIGDARAVPTVVRMLFEERGGVSFFPQASFAAVQLGKPMAARLQSVVDGRDAELEAWAAEKRVLKGALYAKAAQLLGDVGGPEAVPSLLARLGYADADPSLAMLVHVFAAESLGRLRAREAVKPLSDLLAKEDDPDARDRYCDALARIGDPAGLPALRAAVKGDWGEQAGPLTALSRLGGAAEVPVVETARAACGSACPQERAAALAGMKARLAAAAACTDARCWAGKLQDPAPEVRDRAALELGRTGGASDAPALAEAILRPVTTDADLEARYHAVLGLAWVAARAPLAAAGPELAAKLEAMISSPAERGRRLTEGVNEDALRLAARLRRAQ